MRKACHAVTALPELLGRSPAIVAVRERVSRFLTGQSSARRPPPILIQGETGTGKGMLAQLIHRVGPRRDGPFVDVNCAAIPETLIEAELFGFERGAFTDARQAKPGLFQAAHHGTIFLDEVGLLPDAAQVKLLKVLEEREVRRLGATKSEPADVAVVSATNEPLDRAVRERRLREDLYHRLAVLTITLPRLCDRGDDVLLLADHFLARVCADYGLGPRTLSREARAALCAYPWPGNVRQLANVLERAALLSEARVIPLEALELPPATRDDAPGAAMAASEAPTVPVATSEAAAASAPAIDERDRLLDALTATEWNVSRAAARLGISRNTIRYRIEKHALRPGTAVSPSRRLRTVPRAEPEPAVAPAAQPPRSVVRWQPRRVALLRADIRAAAPADAARALDALVDKADLFGGRVDELAPSGVWAVFGVDPVEDAPRRAANAALAMRRAAEQLGTGDGGAALHVAVAVHVVELSLGAFADSVHIERVAKRAALDTLDGVVQATPDDTVAVTEAAAAFLERRFELEPLPAATVPAMRIVAAEATGFRLRGRLGPFVDREDEIALLSQRVAAAARGEGQVIGIVGDAGMGKSRLLFELRQRLPRDSTTFLEGRCVSYGSGIPYVPLVDVVRAACGTADADTPDDVVAKLSAMLGRVGIDAVERAPYLAWLLGIKQDGTALGDLSAEALQARVFDTLRQWLVRESRRRPLLLLVEDLHWIDRSTEEFLDSLVDAVSAAPMLLVYTSRPGYRAPWSDRAATTQVALPPLPAQHQPLVVRSVLGARELPRAAMDAVLTRAEGNPFFLEELTRAIDDRGGFEPTAVPATIQDVLLARIEHLGPDARSVLQLASVLGRRAPLRLLAALWDGAADLEAELRTLARGGFVYEALGAAEPTYVFKHALTAEVAYATVPVDRRATLHAAAGSLLERLYADRLEEVYDRLAHHFSRARDVDKGVTYLARLADSAAASYAHAEAVDALAEARVLAADLPPGAASQRRLVELALRQAHSLHFLGRFNSALDVLRAQEPLVASLDAAGAGHYHFWLARTLSVLGDRDATHVHVQQALALAEQAADTATVGKASFLLAFEDYWAGRFADGITHARRAIASLAASDERWWVGMSQWALALNAVLAGEFAAAGAAAAAAEEIGQAMDDARLQSYAGWTAGWIAACAGQTASALDACRRSLERSRDPVSSAYALGQYGHAHLEAGEPKRAAELLDDAIARLAEFRPGFRQTSARFLGVLADARLALGDAAQAGITARQALDLATGVGFAYAAGLARRALGRVAEADGDLVTARAELTQALDTFAAIGARFEAAHTHARLAAVALAAEARDDARTHLAAARAAFAALGVEGDASLVQRLAERLDAA
jgi:DNA-binding NtrC family response regulator/tetratricopeptide (TPR) repeat protein